MLKELGAPTLPLVVLIGLLEACSGLRERDIGLLLARLIGDLSFDDTRCTRGMVDVLPVVIL